VAIATAYGLAYLSALVRGRGGWARHLRPANLRLALGVCALALLLATPLVSFNLLATRDQLARLEAGAIPPEKFDWAALAYDFGRPGRAALEQLKGAESPEIRKLANRAESLRPRIEWLAPTTDEDRARTAEAVRVLPAGRPAPPALIAAVADFRQCTTGDQGCTVILLDSGAEAIVLQDACYAPDGTLTCHDITHFRRVGDKWRQEPFIPDPAGEQAVKAKRLMLERGYSEGKVEVRIVESRQLFIGGVPVGDPFE